jgi:hypothetical protein
MDAMWQRQQDSRQHQHGTNDRSQDRGAAFAAVRHDRQRGSERQADHPHDRMWNRNKLDAQMQQILNRAGPTGRAEFDKVIYGKPERTWHSPGSANDRTTNKDDADIFLSIHQEPFKESAEFSELDRRQLPNGGRLGQVTENIGNQEGMIQYKVPFTGLVYICVQSKLASILRPSRAGLLVERSRDLEKVLDDQTKGVSRELLLVGQRLRQAQNRINEVIQESHLSKDRHTEFYRQSTTFHSDSSKYPIIQIIILLLTATLQTIYMVRYFKQRHLVG